MAMVSIFLPMTRIGSPYFFHKNKQFQAFFFELIKSARTLSTAVALKIFSMKCVPSAKKIVAAYSKVKYILQLASTIYCAAVDLRQTFSNDKKSIKNMVS